MYKNKLNRLVSFLLLVTLILPLLPRLEAKSAVPNKLSHYFFGRVTEGAIDNSPIISTDGDSEFGDNAVAFSWQFNEYGTFELSYVRDKQTSSGALVTFKATKDPSSDAVLVSYSTEAVVTTAASIHSNIGVANGSKQYIDYNKYVNPNNNYNMGLKNEGNYVVPNNGGGMGGVNNSVDFVLVREGGYSFLYDGQTIHFLWKGNQFYFVTNKLRQGYIYDFNLRHTYDGINYTNCDTVNVLSGLDPDSFSTTPKANDGKTSNDIISYKTDPKVPGSPAVSLDFSFGLPKVFINDQWVPVDSQIVSSLGYNLILNAYFVDNYNRFFQLQYDLANLNAVSVVSSPNLTGEIIAAQAQSADGRSTISVSNLLPGLLFSPRFYFTDNGSFKSKALGFLYGKFYTFLQYEVENWDNNYFLVFKPYFNHVGYYRITTNGISSFSIPVLSNEATNAIQRIPITTSTNTEFKYQIFYNPDNDFSGEPTPRDNIHTQIYEFMPDPSSIGISIPRNLTVVDFELLPKNINDLNQANLDLTLEWDISTLKTLDALLDASNPLDLEYELRNSLLPNNENATPFASVGLSISRSGSIGSYVYSIDYRPLGNTEILSPLSGRLITRLDSVTTIEKAVARVMIRLDAGYKEADIVGMPFYYPNIYFLSVKPIGRNYKVGASLDTSLTLSELTKPTIPPPQNFQAFSSKIENNVASFSTSWFISDRKLSEYLRNFSLPANAQLSMNMYISTDEVYMRETFSTKKTIDERLSGLQSLYFTPGSSEINLGNRVADLREGKVVPVVGIPFTQQQLAALTSPSALSNVPFTFTYPILGVDKNQRYYLYVDLLVDYADSNTPQLIEVSKLSELVGITTPGDQMIPTGEDKVPLAVKLDKENIGLDRATIFWNKIPISDPNESIEYEIIRLKEKQLDPDSMLSKLTFEEFWKTLPDVEKRGFETDNQTLSEYVNSAFAEADKDLFIYEEVENFKKLTDKTLIPNTLYFYYVRTVKVIGDSKLYSSWTGVSVTTTPVKQPLNLKIEPDMEGYDPKREIFISFDAPIADLEMLGKEFDLQYQIKEEDGEWGEHVTMRPADLKKSATKPADTALKDYYHFIYKVTNLKPGKSYEIRVRLISKNGDASLYTNVVRYRTEIDQGEYDLEEDLKSWTTFLYNELQKLLKNPYWTIKSTASDLEVVYREPMFNSVLAGTTDASINLPECTTKGVYYIPFNNLLAANAATKGFRLKFASGEIFLPPGFITEVNEDAVLMLRLLKDKVAEDLFLRITVTKNPYAGLVNGEAPMSDAYEIAVELVSSKATAKNFDDDILATLIKRIQDTAKSQFTADQIKKMLKNNALSEEMVQFVKKTVANSSQEINAMVNSSLLKILGTSQSVKQFEKDVIIVAKEIDSTITVRGYKFGLGFQELPVLDYSSGKAIATKTPGIFIFTGSQVPMPELMVNSEAISSLIAKYNLKSFIEDNSPGNTMPIETSVTNRTVASILAIIGGAPRGTDYYNWLSKNLNLNLSKRNEMIPMRNADVIFATMHLYEHRTKSKVSSVRITNFNKPSNIASFEDKYKPYVRAAYNLGVCTGEPLNPTDTVTVGQFLDMLTNFVK